MNDTITPKTNGGPDGVSFSASPCSGRITRLWVDVWSSDARALWRAISKWKSTVDISTQPAQYHSCQEYSRFAVDTALSLDEFEERLYRSSLESIGVGERKDSFKKDGFLFDKIETIPASELG